MSKRSEWGSGCSGGGGGSGGDMEEGGMGEGDWEEEAITPKEDTAGSGKVGWESGMITDSSRGLSC